MPRFDRFKFDRQFLIGMEKMKREQDKIRYPGTRRSSTKAFIRQMICQQLLFNFCCFRCYILILSTIVSDTILDTNLDIYLYTCICLCITY
jgi:hypothetical protein